MPGHGGKCQGPIHNSLGMSGKWEPIREALVGHAEGRGFLLGDNRNREKGFLSRFFFLMRQYFHDSSAEEMG